VFTRNHDQEIEISDRFYLEHLPLFALECPISPCAVVISIRTKRGRHDKPKFGAKQEGVEAFGFHCQGIS
jgi:hypothetical protein